jgi:hypothetical protein
VDVDLLAVLEDERDRIRDDREQNDEPCEDAPLGRAGSTCASSDSKASSWERRRNRIGGV